MSARSTIKITVRSGARVRWRTPGHDEALTRQKIYRAIFEIDQETSIEDEKEFINLFVFMPMIFALNYGQPDDRIVYLAQRLVVPLVRAGISQLLQIDQF